MRGALSALARLEEHGVIHAAGFSPPAKLTYRRLEAICIAFREARESLNFVAGDIMITAEERFGDEGYQAIEELGMSVGTRQQCIRVALSIPQARRRIPPLTWSHHRAVAPLPPNEQDEWLQRAIDNAWTKGELEAQLRNQEPLFEPAGELEPPATVYVVEPVLSAAEKVWANAEPMDDHRYAVDGGAMIELGKALGAL